MEDTPPPSRQIVDYGNEYTRWTLCKKLGIDPDPLKVRPEPSFIHEMVPQVFWRGYPATGLCTHFVHMSVNKTRQPVICISWTPGGRRLLTGASSGEFTLWHGMTFNFESLMQAHENEVRSLAYSHSGEWLLSGDRDGTLKVWQPNFNNVNIVNGAHRESIPDIAWSPSDAKFVTASDDAVVKVWSFATMTEESALTGHGWDAKCVDWHPSMSLIASGSKDNTVKLWDPRQAKCLSTLHGFKNTLTRTKFQKQGGQHLLASASRDNTARIFDLRMMQHVLVLRGHESDVTAIAWHPVHPELLSTATRDGAINHFLLDTQLQENSTGLLPAASIPKAHGWPVWDLAYHPAGHLLASGSNDKSVRFWTRGRPGDPTAFKNRFFVESTEAAAFDVEKYRRKEREQLAKAKIPGLGVDSVPELDLLPEFTEEPEADVKGETLAEIEEQPMTDIS